MKRGKLLTAIAVLAVMFAGAAVVFGDAQETDAATKEVSNLEGLKAALETSDSIVIAGTVVIAENVDLDFKGRTITATVDGYAISIEGCNDVKIKGLVLDNGNTSKGINVYKSTVIFDDVSSTESAGAGLVVGDTADVTATNLAASGAWGGVNVDKGGKFTVDTMKNIDSIYSENYVSADISVDDAAVQMTATWKNEGGQKYGGFFNNINDAVAVYKGTDIDNTGVVVIDVNSDTTLDFGDEIEWIINGKTNVNIGSNAVLTINSAVKNDGNISNSGEVRNNAAITGTGSVANYGQIVNGPKGSITTDVSGNEPSKRVGIDSTLVGLEGDLILSGEGYIAGSVSLTIPADKSLIIRSGASLDLNGNKLIVEGKLVIETGGSVIDLVKDGEIELTEDGVIENSGIIGYKYNSVKVSANAGSYVNMLNVEGVSFGVSKDSLTVTGDVYATSGSVDTFTFAMTGVSIVGNLTTGADVDVNSKNAKVTKGAVFTMEGELTGDVKMVDGSRMIITGDCSATINAETGKVKSSDVTNGTVEYATTSVTLDKVTDIELYVQSASYTEKKTAMTEQALFIKGTAGYLGDSKDGSITITKGSGSGVDAIAKIAADDILALDEKMTFNGADIVVLGQIQTSGSGDNLKSFVGTKYTVVDSTDKTKKTTYVTTFEKALEVIDTVDKKTVYVYGDVGVKADFALADGQKIDVRSGDFDITSDASVTLQKGSSIVGKIHEVEGVLFVQKGASTTVPMMYAVEGTNKETGDKTYAGLEAAIKNSVAGDEIKVIGKGYGTGNALVVKNSLTVPADRTVINMTAITFEKNLVIEEGAKFTNQNEVAMSGEKATISVNGVMDSVSGAIKFSKAGGNINAAGEFIVGTEGALTISNASVNGAYYLNKDSKYSVTTFAKAVAAVAAIEGEQTVTVIGKVSESGDVTVSVDKVEIAEDAKVTLGNVTISNTEIAIAGGGEFTATVIGAYGADGATANATVVLSKANSMTVSNTSAVDDMNVKTWYNNIDAINGTATFTAGEFQLTGTGDVSADENSVVTVASGATLVVVNTIDVTDATYLKVEGTVITKGDVTFSADAKIAGTLDIRSDVNVVANKTLTVTGSVIVSADEKAPGTLKVAGRLNVGAVPGTLGAATGSVSGIITVDGGNVVVYTGAFVEKVVDTTETDLKSTKFVINDIEYATAYGTAKITELLNDEVEDLKDLKVGIDGITWYSGTTKVVNETIGQFETVTSKIAWADVGITISAGPGLEIYIDNVKMNGDMHLAVGEHTVTVYVKAGYEGTAKITLNGTEIADGKFTLTSDMINGDNVLYATGATPIDYNSGTTIGGDDGMSLTDILLIILVVMVVILAIVVILRMMRS